MFEKKIEEFINISSAYINSYVIEKSFKHKWKLSDIYPYIDINEEHFGHVDYDIEDYLGQLYETIIPDKNKKDLGKFYTRDTQLIGIMVNSVDLFKGKILEPSCGSGCFIVAVIKKIIEELQRKNMKAKEIINYIIENVYANDIDPIALKITEINIIGILSKLLIEAKNDDDNYVMPQIKLFNYDFTQKDTFSEKFAVIIGNPPFVTMYGKRSRNMTEEKRAFYNTYDFVQNKKGNNKFNISMFFLENGLKMLEKNGQLAYVMDIAFYETAFADMRQYIVKNYYVDSLITGLQEFENVASGQLVLKIINKCEYNCKVNIIDFHTKEVKRINQRIWDDEKKKFKFYIPLDGIEDEINSKIEKYDKLDSYFPNKSLRTCCALTGKTDEFIVDPKERKKTNHIIFPYIEGSKGLKRKFDSPTISRYIKYDYGLQIQLSNEFKKELEALGVKNKKRVTLGDKNAYLSPKIFIRQSSTEIIATYCEKPYAANNSIYILTTKSSDEFSKNMLKYTCGLLNSDLITFFCRINKIIRNEKGKTPQIKLSDLKNIRLKVDINCFDNMVSLVDELLVHPLDKNLNNRLNEMVFQIYEIDEREREYIRKYLSA